MTAKAVDRALIGERRRLRTLQLEQTWVPLLDHQAGTAIHLPANVRLGRVRYCRAVIVDITHNQPARIVRHQRRGEFMEGTGHGFVIIIYEMVIKAYGSVRAKER